MVLVTLAADGLSTQAALHCTVAVTVPHTGTAFPG
jgi:hypothetical protein